MESFTYHSLFDTKGIEYLIIIAFFIIFIPFWLLLSKRKSKPILKQISSLSARISKTPMGVFFNPNHTWTFLEKSGKARVGIDELIPGMAGDFNFEILAKPGDRIHKFDPLGIIQQDEKKLLIRSPLSGIIDETNNELEAHADELVSDNYSNGWIVSMEPSNWMEETQKCLFGKSAQNWLSSELSTMRDFILNQTNKDQSKQLEVALQDGGEPTPDALKVLPKEGWQRFQERFM